MPKQGLANRALNHLPLTCSACPSKNHFVTKPPKSYASNQIEPHLAQVHRPIHDDETIHIDLGGKEQVHLDSDTKDYVTGNNLSHEAITYHESVTRLNVVTGNGRFYAEELSYIIPFMQLIDFEAWESARALSWSLREADRGVPAEIEIDVRQFTSNSGRLKRLLVIDSRQRLGEAALSASHPQT